MARRTHVVIMRRSWGLIDKILSGQKTIESRWYKNKCKPWNQISPGHIIYFKDSGGPVKAKAKVIKIEQFSDLNYQKAKQILNSIKKSDLGLDKDIPREFQDYIKGKQYCMLVYFNQVQTIKSFNINKKGFGTQAAWIIVDDIGKIRVK